MTEKPLNVRVAEAIGWADLREDNGRWWGYPPEWFDPVGGCLFEVPPWGEGSQYGWKWTGPLIERYCPEIIIRDWRRFRGDGGGMSKGGDFQAYPPGDPIQGWGASITEAICNLILALAEAGRLPK